MEWVTITAATVDDAITLALDQLGVAREDAELEIVEEPKPGLFGRLRGEAVVRARVRPTAAREGARRERGGERGDRRGGRSRQRQRSSERRSGPSDTSRGRERSRSRGPVNGEEREGSGSEHGFQERDTSPRSRPDTPKVPAATVSDAATTFLTGVFAAAGISVQVDAHVEGDEIEVSVHGDDVQMFVGPRGQTLTQLQDITRVVSQRKLGDHDTRLRLDVGGYRQRRKEALGRFAQKVANDVMESGTPRILEPMNSADRKIVHDTLAEVAGVVTHSEGDDPFRRVVVSAAPDA
jgi:spoIIIJ-associated protein